MTLGDRLELLEKHSGEFHDYVHNKMFKWVKYAEASDVIDRKFRDTYRYWQEHQDSASKVAANFLLQTMAIMYTREYKKRRRGLNGLAEELDIKSYTPAHLRCLVNEENLLPNKFRRLKTRVRRGLLEAEFLSKKDERYSTLVDYLGKLHAILSKE